MNGPAPDPIPLLRLWYWRLTLGSFALGYAVWVAREVADLPSLRRGERNYEALVVVLGACFIAFPLTFEITAKIPERFPYKRLDRLVFAPVCLVLYVLFKLLNVLGLIIIAALS